MRLAMIGTRRTVVFAVVFVAAWAVALATRAPGAGAHSCPQRRTTAAQHGLDRKSGGLSYVSGTVTKPDIDGDETQTMSLNHRASGMKFVLAKPQQGSGGFGASGQPTGGR